MKYRVLFKLLLNINIYKKIWKWTFFYALQAK